MRALDIGPLFRQWPIRSWFLLGLTVGGSFVLGIHGAFAQLSANLELDGDARDAAPGPLPDDWDFINPSGGNSTVHSGLLVDGLSVSIFIAGGSRDPNNLDQWACADGAVPAKDDIVNAMAALYPGDFLYFAGDRYGQNADAFLGFWFLQSSASCTGTSAFSGTHQVGDILVLASFRLGGATSIVPDVFRWVGDGSGSAGNLDAVPVSSAQAVVLVNATPVGSPWPYQAIVPCTPPSGYQGCYPPSAFFEGGLDLGALGLAASFNTFIMETRSSQSPTASLKDFALGDFHTTSTSILNDPGPGREMVTPFDFFPVRPNPTRGSLVTQFHLATSEDVEIRLHDVSGKAVATVTHRRYPAGAHEVTWTGTDDTGKPLVPGVYFLRLRAGPFSTIQRVTVAR